MLKTSKILLLTVLIVMLLATMPVAAQQKDISLPDIPGRVAFIGEDYNVYSTDFVTEDSYQLTDDGDRQHQYVWVTWSRNGQLAYFCCDLQSASDFTTQAFISEDGQQTGINVFESIAQPIIYAAWSPASCLSGSGCDVLAMLVNDVTTGSLRVDLVQDVDGESLSQTIASGSPFYFNWSPGGDRMVFHRRGEAIDVYDLQQASVLSDQLQTSSGLFQTPAWSPVDDRILVGVPGDEDGLTTLVIQSPEGQKVIAENLKGQVSFLWSPDGNHIAYRTFDGDNYSSLYVLDAISSELVSRTTLDGVLSFFWSPDSSKIAYLTLSGARGSFSVQGEATRQPVAYPVQTVDGLAWNTLDIESGIDRVHSSFLPTAEMIYMLVYFDQFARSHRIWSPDSTHLIFSELATDGEDNREPVVSILDVTTADTVPLTIAHGVFAVWSFE